MRKTFSLPSRLKSWQWNLSLERPVLLHDSPEGTISLSWPLLSSGRKLSPARCQGSPLEAKLYVTCHWDIQAIASVMIVMLIANLVRNAAVVIMSDIAAGIER